MDVAGKAACERRRREERQRSQRMDAAERQYGHAKTVAELEAAEAFAALFEPRGRGERVVSIP
jgi:hypothetical protein